MKVKKKTISLWEHIKVNQAQFWKSKRIKKDNKFKELWEVSISMKWNIGIGLGCLSSKRIQFINSTMI